MMELPPEIINEIIQYLSNNETQICLDTSPIFDVLTFNNKFDIKLSNTKMYLQHFSIYRTNTETFHTSVSVHKTLKSAAFKLFKTVMSEPLIAKLDVVELCNEWEKNPASKYLYNCITNNIYPIIDTYANKWARYMIDECDIKSTDDVLNIINDRIQCTCIVTNIKVINDQCTCIDIDDYIVTNIEIINVM